VSAQNQDTTQPSFKFEAKHAVLLLIASTLLPATLLISAGTLRWPMGWVYAVIAAVTTLVSRLLLIFFLPDVAAERANFNKAEDNERWDQILSPMMGLYIPLVQMIVAGLDYRFELTPYGIVPLWLAIFGLVLLVLGWAIGAWAMFTNRFFSGVMRIQTDRNHTVQIGGPYQLVRHPAYSGFAWAGIGSVLMLGTLWAMIPAVVNIIVIVIRTALEDRTLQEELPGYIQYSKRTRYRLIPGIW
jgi:protein-S-isoprenylcysteine O-methyltransferase Ste14